MADKRVAVATLRKSNAWRSKMYAKGKKIFPGGAGGPPE
jgi:hypothetical protein